MRCRGLSFTRVTAPPLTLRQACLSWHCVDGATYRRGKKQRFCPVSGGVVPEQQATGSGQWTWVGSVRQRRGRRGRRGRPGDPGQLGIEERDLQGKGGPDKPPGQPQVTPVRLHALLARHHAAPRQTLATLLLGALCLCCSEGGKRSLVVVTLRTSYQQTFQS
ncbi:hypothetical protein E2C01_069382 [Portunus trituberculatus]|uniref:Uncharacterized protein n=1 Tax=Portunus trituberculatus TaxID=210409 RepID=A0A5B7HZ70_PORTR|nr:hypothetical protein [Portunus trituberculatus]